MNEALPNIVITADSHIGEPAAFRERLPEAFRDDIRKFTYDDDGRMVADTLLSPTEEDLLREFRTDPDEGTNIDRRLHDMALEGVQGEVIFPNRGLGCSLGTKSAAFYQAWARAYNDYAWDTFADHRERFKVAALLAVDDIDECVAEARRSIDKGFCTLFLPATVPWQPYHLDIWDPLWRLAEEAGVSVNFHIFSGNLAIRCDFASVGDLDQARFDLARKVVRDEDESNMEELLNATTLGAAAGMSPIVELIGSGALDKFPDLQFVVTESECGWLPWFLQFMDQMQSRRYLNMRTLKHKASDYFRRQGTITISDDAVGLGNVDFIGAGRMMWGNDYPHDEGTFLRSDGPIADIRAKLNEDDAHQVLCGNAARLYGFDLNHLAAHSHEVTGP
jgi:predicted TIM-barrel fold metal-dependent hydrolase